MTGSRARRVAVGVGAVAVTVLLAAGAGAGAYLTTDSARTHAVRPAAVPAPPVAVAHALSAPAADPTGTPTEPSASGVRRVLAGAVRAAGLGARLRADVIDVASGAHLYDAGADTPTAPASTAKLLTAAAVLSVLRPTDRFVTRVLRGPGAAVILVGGGDPTLSAAPSGSSPTYPGAARIAALAGQLRRAGVRPDRIVIDDALFTGPAVSPSWAGEDVPSAYAAPITALTVDGGRDAPGDVMRSTAPDLAAGHALAASLGAPNLPVTRGSAPAAATTLATVRSAEVGTLVFQMLQDSDNVIAETLGRQVAVAEHCPASFTGAAAAIRATLVSRDIDVGATMVDASGLAARDRVTPAVLAQVVRAAAAPGGDWLGAILSALPVAGWSGTLADRYTSGAAAAAAGDVRAKTGTLTGVSTLAGLVHDRSGRLLAFALMADRTVSTPGADAALDVVAARLATCGCS